MKVTLMPGIESISGSVKGKNGTRMVFKTYTKPAQNRTTRKETRCYIMKKNVRRTPLSDNEIAARNRFARASYYYTNLSEKERKAFAKEFHDCDGVLNGKKYATLRGYIVAKFYLDNPSKE